MAGHTRKNFDLERNGAKYGIKNQLWFVICGFRFWSRWSNWNRFTLLLKQPEKQMKYSDTVKVLGIGQAHGPSPTGTNGEDPMLPGHCLRERVGWGDARGPEQSPENSLRGGVRAERLEQGRTVGVVEPKA